LVRDVTGGSDAEGRIVAYDGSEDGAGPQLYPTLHAWADLMASNVNAHAVGVVMLGSDPETTDDRRLARELGARVGVVDEAFADVEDDDAVTTIRDRVALESFLGAPKLLRS